jgi:hypothetical protein
MVHIPRTAVIVVLIVNRTSAYNTLSHLLSSTHSGVHIDTLMPLCYPLPTTLVAQLVSILLAKCLN